MKFLEGVLELGRNWAVAVAVAAFGAAAYHSEAVTGPWQEKGWMLATTYIFALVWVCMAILRFLDVMDVKTKGIRQTMKALLIASVLVGIGLTLVIQTATYADNAMLVRLCKDYRDKPTSAVHSDARCQRLYKHQAERERIYLGQ